MPVAYARSHKDKHRPVARLLHFATSDGSGATFRYTRRRTLHTGSYTLFSRVYPFLELPTPNPALCGNCRLRWKSLMMGYTYPIASAETCSGRSACCGGIANLTMRKCRKRSRGKHTFGTAQDSRQVCLFHLETRGHAETILAKRTTRHARACPPLRTPTLRYTSQSRHLCQRTFEYSHTPHLPTQTAQDRP